MKRHIWLVALIVGAGSVAFGLTQGRWDIVLQWGQALCASCVGLGG